MISRDLFAGFTKLICGAKARWIGCRPDTRQRVYFANHTSNLDFPAIWSVLPPQMRGVTRPAAAEDYWNGGLVRRFLAKSLFNAVLIHRRRVSKRNHPIERLLQAMGNRYSLVIFPEGGRSYDLQIHKFKGGLYHLGKRRPDVELVPVYIHNLTRVLPKGEFLPVPLLSTVSFGYPLHVERSEPKSAFLERARAAVCRLQRAYAAP